MIDAHIHYDILSDNPQNKINELNIYLEQQEIEYAVLYNNDKTGLERKHYALNYGDRIIPGFMIDPRSDAVEEMVQTLHDYGIQFVKILPYEQSILKKDYDSVVNLARLLEKHDMVLVICSSYGSKHIYETNGVELTEYVLSHGIQSPIIMAHGGMVRVLDTLLLMDVYPNLYFDLSFSLAYWWGSGLIQDYYFVCKKLKFNRIFYGSDYPYVSFEESMKYFEMFCNEYKISCVDKQKMLYHNFKEFYGNLTRGGQ